MSLKPIAVLGLFVGAAVGLLVEPSCNMDTCSEVPLADGTWRSKPSSLCCDLGSPFFSDERVVVSAGGTALVDSFTESGKKVVVTYRLQPLP